MSDVISHMAGKIERPESDDTLQEQKRLYSIQCRNP